MIESPSQSAVRPCTTPPAAADRGAMLFVWGIWAILLIGAVMFIRTYSCNVPFVDEWGLVAAATRHEPVTLKYLWNQHNEHRIFLPRLLYLGLARLTGGDFRAGMYFIAAALAGAAGAMIVAAQRLRGWTSYADAFFPLALLHLGHCENLLWSFQVVFIASTILICGLLLLILHSRQPLTWRTALAGGLCLIGLPLCGANGIPLVPPLAVWHVYWAVRHRKTPGWAGLGNLALVVVLVGVALTLVKLYFIGFYRVAPPSPAGRATAQVAGEFLAMSLGYGIMSWWPYVGYAIGGTVVFSAVILVVRWWQQPMERARSAGLLLFLVGLVGLALAIGWGRAGFGLNQGFCHRYSMLAAPVLCGVFFLGEITGPAAFARFLQMALFTCIAVVLVPNIQAGLAFGAYRHNQIKAVERDLQPDFSSGQVAAKHLWICPNREFLESRLEMLRGAGIGKFKRLSAVSPAPCLSKEKECH